ncbi:MAG: F0F1 ATP synthase subunit epsilon [Candidatus Mariimomonas ferrooxydans]
MENKLQLDIVTPYGLVFSEEVDEVVATGGPGEFGVLPGHIPFITTLKIGMLTYKKGAETGHFFVSWGFAEAGPDKVLILADSAERSEDIDIERAKEAKKRAEEKLRKAEKFDEARATSSVERSKARIHIAGMK